MGSSSFSFINRPRHFGITPPISVSRSTEREEEITVTLLEELRCQCVFESEEGSQLRCVCSLYPSFGSPGILRDLTLAFQSSKSRARSRIPSSLTKPVALRKPMLILTFLAYRETVLGRVGSLVKKFVREVVHQRAPSDSAADTTGGKIFTFGSYSLGVHGPESDIDVLCVVPMQVSREDFFGVFAPMLKELEGVTEVLVCGPFLVLFLQF